MTIYESSLFDNAVPISSSTSLKKKGGKKKIVTPDNVVVEQAPQASVRKPRKPMSDELKAKLAEGRARKKAEKEAEAKAALDTESAAAAKKEAAKEKRRLARQAKKAETSAEPKSESVTESTADTAALEKEIDTEVAKITKKRKAIVKKDPSEAPKWFTTFVEGFKQEENTLAAQKKPRKAVKEESQALAQERW